MKDAVASENGKLGENDGTEKQQVVTPQWMQRFSSHRWVQWSIAQPWIKVSYGIAQNLGLALWRRRRALFCTYAVVLLIVVTVQAVCIALLWQPPQEWVSFFARFATSPAIAGLFALLAALIGARSLGNQLSHTKEKAADEAWWQQFEWVTDRLITSAKSHALLPSSLAFDLTSSLSRSARAPFQRDAVDGILKHYLKEFMERDVSSSDRDQSSSSDGPGIDAAGANSLRNLIDALPESSLSSAPARRLLQGYEYEQEILRALRHQGFDEIELTKGTHVRPDGLFTTGSEKFIVEVKSSIDSASVLGRVSSQVRQIMASEGASHGFIITPTASLEASLAAGNLAADGIHLVEWVPSMGSSELKRQIRKVIH